jgi:hypothetical protein
MLDELEGNTVNGEGRQQIFFVKEIFLSFLYTKSRALPNSITIAFSSPKLAKPPALPPPPHEGAIFFRSRSQKFTRLSIQEAQLRLREGGAAVSGSSLRRRRECAAFAARGARKPRNEPEPSRLREGRSRRHETGSGSSQLRKTRGCSGADPPAAAAGGERSKLL